MKISLAVLLVFISTHSLLGQKKGTKVNSTIKEVTVYLSGSRIKRMAPLTLKAGKNELILNKLSALIDESSIQIAGLKNANVLSVNYEIDYLEKKVASEKVKELKLKKEDLLLRKDQIQNTLTAYDKELKVFDYNLRVNSDQTDLSLDKLKLVGAYHRERTNVILDKKFLLKQKLNKLNLDINKLTNEINKTQGNTKEEYGQIRIKLEVPSATTTNLIVSYNVSQSGWFPEYDLKSNSIKSDLNIVYKAKIYQETGISWKNVDITLSTGDPTLDNNKPALESKYLNFVYGNYRKQQSLSKKSSNFKYNPTVRTVTGTVTGSGLPLPGVNITIPGTNKGEVSDFDGNYSIELPAGSQSLDFSSIGFKSSIVPIYASRINMDLEEDTHSLEEVVIIGYGKKSGSGKALANRNRARSKSVSTDSKQEDKSYNKTVDVKQEGITNTSFKIKKKYTIESNSESTAIEIDQFSLPTKYSYYVAPELNKNVFLTATLSNWEQFDLLTGEANIYFEGSYVGKALIEPNSTKEKLVLSLGVDPNIVVERKEPKNFKSKSFTGGTRIVKKTFEISIKNNKSQVVDLVMEERIPISNNKEIKVDDVLTEGAVFNAKKGIAKWTIKIPSKQSLKKELSYTVKYPKGKRVNL